MLGALSRGVRRSRALTACVAYPPLAFPVVACTPTSSRLTAPESAQAACPSPPNATLDEIVEACKRYRYPEPEATDFDVHLKLDLPPELHFELPTVSIESWFGGTTMRTGALLDGGTCTNVELSRSPDGAHGILYSESSGQRYVLRLWIDTQLRIDPCHVTTHRREGARWVPYEEEAYCADHEKALGLLTSADHDTLQFKGQAAQLTIACRRSVPPCDCSVATLGAAPAQPPHFVAASDACAPSQIIEVLSHVTRRHHAWLPRAQEESQTLYSTFSECQQALAQTTHAGTNP